MTAKAGVGFTVKSGWAATVLVTGTVSAPRVADLRRIDLSDPAVPDSRQPYHAGFGTARSAGAELSTLVASVRRFGQRSVATLLRQYQSSGHDLRGAGIIVGSLIDPDTIGNDHIRIHALEGQLFRGVIEQAVARHGLRSSIWRERDLWGVARDVLKKPETAIRATLGGLGRDIDGPWRAEHKNAALAAWLILANQ